MLIFSRAEAINIACYLLNRCMVSPLLEKIPYELLKGRKPNVSHLRDFECKCDVHNNSKEALETFDARSDKRVLGLFAT